MEERGPVRRGELRIYRGAAPGVGKTFAMLGEGHRRASRGTDVVVGFVETHGREKTAALLEGLEAVPRRTLVHRGVELTEMDVDAVLARHPQVALVDELAHTNGLLPTCRGPASTWMNLRGCWTRSRIGSNGGRRNSGTFIDTVYSRS